MKIILLLLNWKESVRKIILVLKILLFSTLICYAGTCHVIYNYKNHLDEYLTCVLGLISLYSKIHTVLYNIIDLLKLNWNGTKMLEQGLYIFIKML